MLSDMLMVMVPTKRATMMREITLKLIQYSGART